MNHSKASRQQFLKAGGVGVLNLAVPGLVVGKDKFDASGKGRVLEEMLHLRTPVRRPQPL